MKAKKQVKGRRRWRLEGRARTKEQRANVCKVVKALASDKYTQVTGSLRRGGQNYCVMGVIGKELGVDWDQCGGGLPDEWIAEELGLTGADQNIMISKNDAGRTSFKTFARVLEKDLLRPEGT